MEIRALEKYINDDAHARKALLNFRKELFNFKARTGITINEESFYIQAFMHSSFINDLQLDKIHNNERLEFLGDAVLELMVSDYIFNRFKELPEGDLTKLRANIVCEPSLVVFASKLKMEPLTMLGRGEEKTGGRQRSSIISDTFEAFLGALYLDMGADEVLKFLEQFVFPHVKNENYNAVADYKTLLQEHMHRSYQKGVEYKLIEASGPSHNKRFVTGVYLENTLIGRGEGRSKKESEQRAAQAALDKSTSGESH